MFAHSAGQVRLKKIPTQIVLEVILKGSPYELVLAEEGDEDAWFPSSWELEDVGITAAMVDGYRLCITSWIKGALRSGSQGECVSLILKRAR